MIPDHSLDDDKTTTARDDSLWLSIAEIAEAKGKTRQTIHERVQKLEDDGLLVTRQGPNRTRLVNLAEYDRQVGETTSFSHQQAATTRSGEISPLEDEGYNAAARRKINTRPI